MSEKRPVAFKLFNAKELGLKTLDPKFNMVVSLIQKGLGDNISVNNSTPPATKLIALLVTTDDQGQFTVPMAKFDIDLNMSEFNTPLQDAPEVTLGYATVNNIFVNKDFKDFPSIEFMLGRSFPALNKRFIKDGRPPLVYAQTYLSPLSANEKRFRNVGFVPMQYSATKTQSRFSQENMFVLPTCLTSEGLEDYTQSISLDISDQERSEIGSKFIQESILTGASIVTHSTQTFTKQEDQTPTKPAPKPQVL